MFERVMLWIAGFGPVVYMTVRQWQLGVVWFGIVLGVALADRRGS